MFQEVASADKTPGVSFETMSVQGRLQRYLLILYVGKDQMKYLSYASNSGFSLIKIIKLCL